MSENSYAIHPIGIEYLCDECGEPMQVVGNPLQSGMIPHACPNSHMKALPQGYPLVRFDRVQNADEQFDLFDPPPPGCPR